MRSAERPRNTRSYLYSENLALAPIHEIVVALHQLLELLHILTGALRISHHLLELLKIRDLHLRDERPILLAGEVGHDAHFRHADLLAELRHRAKLLEERADLSRLAVHDFAYEVHGALRVMVQRRFDGALTLAPPC